MGDGFALLDKAKRLVIRRESPTVFLMSLDLYINDIGMTTQK